MTADSPFHSARLAARLVGSRTPTRAQRTRAGRRRRSQGVVALMLVVLGLAVLLSLAVMFLPLSHPHMRVGASHPDHSRAFILPPLE